MDSKTFNVGDRVLVGGNTSLSLRRGTVTQVVCADGALGGLFRVRFDTGRQLPSGADFVPGRDMLNLTALVTA